MSGNWVFEPTTNAWAFIISETARQVSTNDNSKKQSLTKLAADGWFSINNSQGQPAWYHFDVNGAMEVGLKQYEDKTYFLSKNPLTLGEMSKGWQIVDDGTMRYFGEDGAMLMNTNTPDGHFVDANGIDQGIQTNMGLENLAQ